MHIKFPETQKIKKEKSVYTNNLIKKNKEKHPCPGQYNLEEDLIKKQIFNNKSFGSSVERFQRKEIKIKNNKNRNNIKVYINQFITQEKIKSIHIDNKIKY